MQVCEIICAQGGQVSTVIGVMKDNISKVMERGEKLDDLEEKSVRPFGEGGVGAGRRGGVGEASMWMLYEYSSKITVLDMYL